MATQIEPREQERSGVVTSRNAAEVALQQAVHEMVLDAGRDPDAYLDETQTPHGGE